MNIPSRVYKYVNCKIRNCNRYKAMKHNIMINNKNCEICHTNKDITIHHIKSLRSIIESNKITNLNDALNCTNIWNRENIILVCRKCHDEIHRNKMTFRINIK